ncbi:MAG: Epimerase [Nitrospira sp.]|nr:NAD(P)H-binding protein [Nitrospira sp.]ULA60762.1 MAG: Epimerase [Nitrospira sp.]
MTKSMDRHRIFVTGATGYLGSRLVPLLLERGHDVTALIRPESARKVPAGCGVVVGDPLNEETFAEPMRGHEILVQLIGVPKPSPWKGAQFRAIDGPSAMAAARAAGSTGVKHFVYVSVAHPAPIMRDYIAVRRDCEAAISKAGLVATILRPWYILGPGHWWPLALVPVYRVFERLSGTREAAMRLGLVTLREMLAALLWSIDHPPATTRVIEVPEIRRLGRGWA